MKKRIVALLFLCALFLVACTGNNGYYKTPKDAFLEGSGESFSVVDEIDIIDISDKLILYIALTSNVGRGATISCVIMEKNGDEYRVSDTYGTDVVHTELDKIESMEYSNDAWCHRSLGESEQHYFWQWVATSNIPEGLDGDIKISDYKVEYGDRAYEISLVSYVV